MSRIRIKHLLTHTSGLGSYFNETYERSSRELFREVNDYKRLTADETVQFDPGSRAAYSNTDFSSSAPSSRRCPVAATSITSVSGSTGQRG
jgi:hypothetical protein